MTAPVKGEGFFASEKPDVMLTEIHRQAFDNPLIRMATDVRTGKPYSYDANVLQLFVSANS